MVLYQFETYPFQPFKFSEFVNVELLLNCLHFKICTKPLSCSSCARLSFFCSIHKLGITIEFMCGTLYQKFKLHFLSRSHQGHIEPLGVRSKNSLHKKPDVHTNIYGYTRVMTKKSQKVLFRQKCLKHLTFIDIEKVVRSSYCRSTLKRFRVQS